MARNKGKNFEVDTSGFDFLRQATPQHIQRLLVGCAYEMLADIKLSFNTSPAGNTYTRGNVSHVASQPGYPPNIDTGTLTGSMAVNADDPNRVLIHDGVEYGVYLELGTSSIAPRPFIVPVFEEWRKGKFADFIKSQGIIPWK